MIIHYNFSYTHALASAICSGSKLNDDDSNDINVVDGWVYYRNGSDLNTLYKIRTDGSDKTKLNNEKSHNINVVGDWVYYKTYTGRRDYGHICNIRTDGSGMTKLLYEATSTINVVGDWLYFLDLSSTYFGASGKLCRIRTDGTNLEAVD